MIQDQHRRGTVLSGFFSALSLLTRIPSPYHASETASAAWAWPLVGTLIAMIAGAVGWVLISLSCPPVLVAGLMLLVPLAATGAMHEDGLADTVDAFGAAKHARADWKL